MIGPAGTGKSHTLIALGHAAVTAGLKVKYPVSYTHLDVYKRQVLAFAGGSGVLVGDAVGSPPHGDVTDRGRVGAGDAGRQPSRTPLSRDLSLIHI